MVKGGDCEHAPSTPPAPLVAAPKSMVFTLGLRLELR